MTFDDSSVATIAPEPVEEQRFQLPDGQPDRDRRAYTIIHAFPMSFFSAALYRDVAHRWRGIGLCYLTILMLLGCLPLMYQIHLGLQEFLQNEAPKFFEQVPAFSINNGELSVDAEQPYSITDPDTGEVLIVIDTTGRHTSLDDVEALGLVTKSKLIFQKDGGRSETFNLSEIDDISIDAGQLQEYTEIFAKGFGVVAVVSSYIASWMYRFFQMILFAVVALLFVKPAGSIKFAAMLRIAAVAITPTVAACALTDLCHIPTPAWYWWPFCLALLIVYFWFGVSSRRDAETAPVG